MYTFVHERVLKVRSLGLILWGFCDDQNISKEKSLLLHQFNVKLHGYDHYRKILVLKFQQKPKNGTQIYLTSTHLYFIFHEFLHKFLTSEPSAAFHSYDCWNHNIVFVGFFVQQSAVLFSFDLVLNLFFILVVFIPTCLFHKVVFFFRMVFFLIVYF